MSEADTPKTQLSEEDWETVEFPCAITIDTLARSGTELDDPPDLPSAIALIAQLRQREVQLSQRILELETTVETMKTTRMPSSGVEETADKRIDREPETRQQLLVDTIRKKLETYQQQIAKMRQENALTQQRYQETSHQLQQVEHTCQELRSRLHRQQRHALQFKAALEKCLEAESQNRSSVSSEHPATQFLFSTPASVSPAAASLTTPESEETDFDGLAFFPASPASPMESNGFSQSEPPTHSTSPPIPYFSNPSSVESVMPIDSPTESNTPSASDGDSPLPKRRQSSNLDLPSFPRLS